VRFFYADALDLVDPNFDFVQERSPAGRIPQRDDVYAHELMAPDRPYDGLLVSKYIFEADGGTGRYSQAQRFRFLRDGARKFLRFPATEKYDPKNWPLLGDCGAFNYRDHEKPPFTVEEVIEFYEEGGFTHGVSVDHMIGAYAPQLDQPSLLPAPIPRAYQERFDLTLELADQFLRACRHQNVSFQPIGIAQGWSPRSYRRAVQALVKMGFNYVALGGLVPLKTQDILEVLEEVKSLTGGDLRIHLFGVTRLDNFDKYNDAGVVSLDSASPMRQAFKDARNNFYADGGHYTAVRIPQADKYPKLLRVIRSGQIEQAEAFRLETACRESLKSLDQRQSTVDEVLGNLQAYEALYGGKSKWPAIRRTLEDRPWEHCPCPVCADVGIEVIIFRGANRNRRRGFHNLWYTQRLLNRHRNRLKEA
jgi:hypothetical protein